MPKRASIQVAKRKAEKFVKLGFPLQSIPGCAASPDCNLACVCERLLMERVMIVVASAKVSRQVLFLAKTSVIKAPPFSWPTLVPPLSARD